MRELGTFCVCVALGFSQALMAGPSVLENPLIRVRLESSQEKIEIEGSGIRVQGAQNNFIFVAIPQKSSIVIERDEMAGQGIWKVRRGEKFEIIAQKYLAIQGIDLKIRGRVMPNQLLFSAQKKKFDVIGVLPLEDYLVGVIASEMPLSWPKETLKAQAIAARSYALVTMKERARQDFHVESTILDQVFSHIGRGEDRHPLVIKAKEAVQETAGYVLYGNNQKVLKAFYHSDCGGKTSDAKTVWGYGISTGSAKDESCPGNPKAHWNLSVSEEDLSGKLQTFLKRANLGILQFLNLKRPSKEDRVERVELGFESGEKFLIPAQDFRAAIGYEKLRSTFFDIKKEGSEYQFSGQGFGHGVGLCQWGARFLGKQGKTSGQILAHYYPKATVASRKLQELESRTR